MPVHMCTQISSAADLRLWVLQMNRDEMSPEVLAIRNGSLPIVFAQRRLGERYSSLNISAITNIHMRETVQRAVELHDHEAASNTTSPRDLAEAQQCRASGGACESGGDGLCAAYEDGRSKDIDLAAAIIDDRDDTSIEHRPLFETLIPRPGRSMLHTAQGRNSSSILEYFDHMMLQVQSHACVRACGAVSCRAVPCVRVCVRACVRVL